MGHRPSLTRQVCACLEGKCAFGQSRHEAKKNGTDIDLIFSISSLKTYRKVAVRFVNDCKEKHGCKYLEDCRQYVPEYIAMRMKNLSPSSIKLEASALAKLYGVTGAGGRDKNGRYLSPWGIELPERNRDEFTRSRGTKVRDKDFSEKKNAALVTFCRCVGPRHYKELARMRGTALRLVDEKYYVRIVGKGGRVRMAPICGTDDEIKAVVDRMKAAGSEKVWPAIPSHADISQLVSARAQLDVLNESIASKVEATYVTNQLDSLVQQFSSTLEQLAESLTATFETSIQTATGAIDTKYSLYIRASGDGVEIGRSDSIFRCRLNNERLAFVQTSNGADNIVAYFSNNKLYITNAQITNELIIGEGESNLFKWVRTSTGLGLKYVS